MLKNISKGDIIEAFLVKLIKPLIEIEVRDQHASAERHGSLRSLAINLNAGNVTLLSLFEHPRHNPSSGAHLKDLTLGLNPTD